MPQVHSIDADIFYETVGSGPAVVLLHPFPANRDFWIPVAEQLSTHYRLILPDLRGHGQSGVGEGPATMQKHAADLVKVLDDADVGRAIFLGVSIGGYILLEFWRRNRERVTGLALCNTKAQADTPEARTGRMQAAAEVLETGVEPFAEGMLGKVLGQTTRTTRPDLVEGARKMMLKMSAEDVSQVQKGMAERPDSVATLKTINVPTLLVTGDEDMTTGVPEAELMRQHIVSSEMKVIAKAGHYSPWEQPAEAGRVLRQFIERVY
jgi:pimeloyl-ACP methyl ester carboxylesterase